MNDIEKKNKEKTILLLESEYLSRDVCVNFFKNAFGNKVPNSKDVNFYISNKHLNDLEHELDYQLGDTIMGFTLIKHAHKTELVFRCT